MPTAKPNFPRPVFADGALLVVPQGPRAPIKDKSSIFPGHFLKIFWRELRRQVVSVQPTKALPVQVPLPASVLDIFFCLCGVWQPGLKEERVIAEIQIPDMAARRPEVAIKVAPPDRIPPYQVIKVLVPVMTGLWVLSDSMCERRVRV